MWWYFCFGLLVESFKIFFCLYGCFREIERDCFCLKIVSDVWVYGIFYFLFMCDNKCVLFFSKLYFIVFFVLFVNFLVVSFWSVLMLIFYWFYRRFYFYLCIYCVYFLGCFRLEGVKEEGGSYKEDRRGRVEVFEKGRRFRI